MKQSEEEEGGKEDAAADAVLRRRRTRMERSNETVTPDYFSPNLISQAQQHRQRHQPPTRSLSPSLPSDHYGWINHYCSLCSSFALLLPLFLLLLLLQTISADATASLAAKTRSVCHSLGLSCCFLKNCTPRVCSLALSLSFPSPQLHQV